MFLECRWLIEWGMYHVPIDPFHALILLHHLLILPGRSPLDGWRRSQSHAAGGECQFPGAAESTGVFWKHGKGKAREGL